MNVKIPDPTLRDGVDTVVRIVSEAGGKPYLVGGAVRDSLMGLPVQDVDVEVHGVAPDALQSALSSELGIDLVGAAFGVLKVRGVGLDVSLPRKESKRGLGHKGFEVMSDPDLPIEEASRRRDFTINSMAYDLLEDCIVDPYGGQEDLEAGILRHVSEQFGEDPLRVLRGMQFAARFDFTVAPQTIALCRQLDTEGLPRERIMDEWSKLILLGKRPSVGLRFLQDCDWLRHYPELVPMVDCPQEPEWHPEGDVWTHTLLCLDAFAAERIGDRYEDLVVGFAVLCHDLGKPSTTQIQDGRIRSIGHTTEGEQPTRAFMARLTAQRDLIEDIVPLVTEHLRPMQLYKAQAGDGAIRRLACRVGRIDRLARVETADQKGRGPVDFDVSPYSTWLLERAAALEVKDSAPAPLVLGRHLIQLGMQPGPTFKPILDDCYDAQLDGRITTVEEGIELARRQAGSC